MERRPRPRAFIPSSDDLECRQLMAAGVKTPPSILRDAPAESRRQDPAPRPKPAKATATPTATAATTGAIPRALRIENIPVLLKSLDPDRVLPPELIQEIQDDLRALESTLTRRPFEQLKVFNEQLRDLLSQPSITAQHIQGLSRAFAVALDFAGANPAVTENLRHNLLELSKIDTRESLPSHLAANDFAQILQVALALGRPIPGSANGPQGGRAGTGLGGSPNGVFRDAR